MDAADLIPDDLGPVAWVLEALRKSVDAATSGLNRYARESARLAQSNVDTLADPEPLRLARQQLHQAVGALDMVGMGPAAQVLRALEAAAQRFIQSPELCTPDAAATMERAGFALVEYLEQVVLGKPVLALALFPQYRSVLELVRADRIHPADLWAVPWRWADPALPTDMAALSYGLDIRKRLDRALLELVKSADKRAASDLHQLSLGLAAGQAEQKPRAFWAIAAAYFEALAHGLLSADLYIKRAASRVLLQYGSLARGETEVSERLAHDLLFFCAQATPMPVATAAAAAKTPSLWAVHQAWGLAQHQATNYELPQFGRFDPALLKLTRKRIAGVKEVWAGVSGGDAVKLRNASEAFKLLAEPLLQLYPPSQSLMRVLQQAAHNAEQGAAAPDPAVGLEVATALLYLEAAFEDLDCDEAALRQRVELLAERLQKVMSSGMAQALEPWMEELYRRVSDRQTLGTVVSELRATVGELEKLLDQFFRNPSDTAPLASAPSHLWQMRGVLTVLGLDQAALAATHMRDQVEEILVTQVDEQKAREAGTFDRLGNNLGALGFLIDMLSYQPALAKKLFVFDQERGELRPLMGRATSLSAHPPAVQSGQQLTKQVLDLVGNSTGASPVDLSVRLDLLATHAVLAEQASLASSVRGAVQALSQSDAKQTGATLKQLAATVRPSPEPGLVSPPTFATQEEDIRSIFLVEAREVVRDGQDAVAQLLHEPTNTEQLTTLRRAYHTLKGSSRMVGLGTFGDAAWALEQLLNTWLADQLHAERDFCELNEKALEHFSLWVSDIEAGRDQRWSAEGFARAAEAMRNEQKLLALELPMPLPLPAPSATATTEFDFDLSLLPEQTEEPSPIADSTALDVDVAIPDLVEAQVDVELTDTEITAAELSDTELVDVELSDVELVDVELSAAQLSQTELSDATLSTVGLKPTDHHTSTTAPHSAGVGAEDPLPSQIPAPEFEQTQPADLTTPDLVLQDLPDDAPAPALDLPPLEIEGIDFDSLAAVSSNAVTPLAPSTSPTISVLASSAPSPASTPPTLPAASALPPLRVVPFQPPPEDPEQFKTIDGLRVAISLYNVFLNEADVWSRQLVTELSEWSLDASAPIVDSSVGLAHSLAGSSATVGFAALSQLARALEAALLSEQGRPESYSAKTLVSAAQEIRRLLHQFAAGFLKSADASVLEELQAAPALAQETASSTEPPVPAPSGAQATSPVAAPTPPVSSPSLTPSPILVPALGLVAAGVAATGVGAGAGAGFTAIARSGFGQDNSTPSELSDAIDNDLFPVFEEEAAELIPRLGSALMQWTAEPGRTAARDDALRTLHTLKGSARLAGASALGEMAHQMESDLDRLGSANAPGGSGASTQQYEALLQDYDTLRAHFDTLRASAQGTNPNAALGVNLSRETQPAQLTSLAPPGESANLSVAAVEIPMPQVPRPSLTRLGAGQMVRVRPQLLDRLVNRAGEVMATRSRMEAEMGALRGSLADLNVNLERLRGQLRDIEVQAESQIQSRMASAKESQADFDPLEFDRFTRVQELTRMMAESVSDVATVQRNLQRAVQASEDELVIQARQARDLQRDLLRTRMVEFESIAERLYRVIRQAAKETGKQVKLDIEGGTIEMDRGVLDRMTPAFEHLLRNAVAHGIESPEQRAASGKAASGLVRIVLHQEGNDVSIEFSDDGAGLNLDAIRQQALAQNLVTADQPFTDALAAQLIFTPGFSTATQITELAGRGIGTDVVRSEVNALGGRIETQSEVGSGTRFKLVLPLTTAVTQVVMLRAGDLLVGVPANIVELLQRVPAAQVQQAYQDGVYTFGDETIGFHWFGALLQASALSSDPGDKAQSVVICRSAAQRVAIHVDEVLGGQEVVVKNLGPQLARLPGLAGMTLLASGAVVLIYNPVALASVYGANARALRLRALEAHASGDNSLSGALARPASSHTAPLVLVVDDSITVRRVTQRLLQREGYRVALASDGLHALAALEQERPAVVLCDIEMPRMDGFELIRGIRGADRFKDLPVIVITSRIAQKHRDHAQELGVSHYLGKPYSEDELLSLVRRFSHLGTVAEVPISAA